MVALYPRRDEAVALAVGGEVPEELHVTLAVLGPKDDSELRAVLDVLRPIAASHAPLSGHVGGVGHFDDNGNGEPGIALPDVPGLAELRQAVVAALHAAAIDYARNHGYQAHITIDYGEGVPDGDPLLGLPLHFDELVVTKGGTRNPLPLVGPPAVTASGTPGWDAPGAAEVIDVDALVAQLRGKTDPVRLALIEAVMKKALEAEGIAWDISNPFVARVLAQAASQIVSIADTTQLNVMRIISAAYDQGLSIPATADAIRVGMLEATPARATLIARTELAGAVNGGSLAAVQIVADATDAVYYKEWLTAPGAKDPRHEEYDGLDGQTTDLDGYFDVGGSQLQFPGDPDGPPEEVCNCFPGGTLVVAPRAEMGFRRRYDGPLVRVETDAHHVLAGTPNHPVLTDAGWKALGELREGDRLVCGALREDEARVHPDVQNAPSAIEDVFGALARSGVTGRIAGRSVQFHGDGLDDREVEVVAADRALLDSGQSSSLDPTLERQLVRAGEPAALLAPTRLRADLVVGDRLIPASRVSSGREGTTALWTGLGHASQHGGGTATRLDPSLDEVAPDDVPADAVELGEGLLGEAFAVSLAKVINVKVNAFHGDVFNLQTETGAYLAAGIISHNCRCAMAYVDSLGNESDAGIDLPEE